MLSIKVYFILFRTHKLRRGLEQEIRTRIAIRVAISDLVTCLRPAHIDLRLDLRLVACACSLLLPLEDWSLHECMEIVLYWHLSSSYNNHKSFMSLSVSVCHDFWPMSHTTQKNASAKITKLDIEIFHHESWKSTYLDVKRSKVTVTRYKKQSRRGVLHSCECWLLAVCTGSGVLRYRGVPRRTCWHFARTIAAASPRNEPNRRRFLEQQVEDYYYPMESYPAICFIATWTTFPAAIVRVKCHFDVRVPACLCRFLLRSSSSNQIPDRDCSVVLCNSSIAAFSLLPWASEWEWRPIWHNIGHFLDVSLLDQIAYGPHRITQSICVSVRPSVRPSMEYNDQNDLAAPTNIEWCISFRL